MIKTLVKQIFMLLHHPVLFFKNIRKCIFVGKQSLIKNSNQINFGVKVRIGNQVRIQFYKKDAVLNLKDGVYMGNRNTFLLGGNISIGENTLLASDITIVSENHGNDPESALPYGKQDLICKDVNIGSGSWIGEKVIILPGISIGDKTIIGAGSVVTKNIPDYCIAVGNPAKIIKKYDFNSHTWEII